MSLIVVARKRMQHFITDIKSETMALGFMNKIANKGAINISLKLADKNLLFINNHLEAH